jgi:hypothetical protein
MLLIAIEDRYFPFLLIKFCQLTICKWLDSQLQGKASVIFKSER